MRDRWRTIQVGDLGRVVTGRTPPGNDPAYYGSSIPFLTPSDMNDLRRVERPQRFLSEHGASKLQRCLVPQGVGVSCIGWQMGKAVLIEAPAVTNQQINSIVVNEICADRSFVYYALRERRDELFNLGSGGSRTPILNKGDFERLPFLLPPLDEQRAIAHILGTLDDKIELNRRMNETLEAMARALFKSWFVDFDPVRAKAQGQAPPGMDPATAALFPSEFEPSELGEIPKGWRMGSIADLGDVVTGKTPPTVNIAFFGAGYPFIKIPDMHGKVWVSKAQEQLSETGNTYQRKKLVPPYSIAVSCIATVGLVVLVRYASHTNQQINTLVPHHDISPYWAFLALRGLKATIEARSLGGSVTKNLNKQQFGSINLLIAPERVQQAFSRRVDGFFRRIASNDDESVALTELRDALLPRLLSGKLSIAHAEHLVEATT